MSEREQLSCQELVELVTAYLEGALPDADREEFDRHLVGCDGCREYVEQMRQTIALTGQVRTPDLPPEAERTLLAAFRDWTANA
jgi:anti-sigma factor RsiW